MSDNQGVPAAKKIKLTARVRRGFGHMRELLDAGFDPRMPPSQTIVEKWPGKKIIELNTAMEWMGQNTVRVEPDLRAAIAKAGGCLLTIANDLRGMIVGAAIGAGIVLHVTAGGPSARPAEPGITASTAQPPARQGPDLEDLFRAIGHVESGNNDETPPGDNGQSHGRYQIKMDYWQDAWGMDDGRPVTNAMRRQHIADVTDPGKARETMLRYWRRWCPEALDAGDLRTLARFHGCGGPRARGGAGSEYAERVVAAMD